MQELQRESRRKRLQREREENIKGLIYTFEVLIYSSVFAQFEGVSIALK